MTFLLHDKEAEFDFPVFNYIVWLLSSVTKMLGGHFLWLCQNVVVHYCCFLMSHRIFSLQFHSSLLFCFNFDCCHCGSQDHSLQKTKNKPKKKAYTGQLLRSVWFLQGWTNRDSKTDHESLHQDPDLCYISYRSLSAYELQIYCKVYCLYSFEQ